MGFSFGVKTGPAGDASAIPAEFPLWGEGLHEKERGDGLGVGNASVADHGERLVEGDDQRLEELSWFQPRGALRQLAREEEIDALVRVRDALVDDAEARPLRRRVASLFQQLALRRVEVRLVPLELPAG